MVPQSAPRDLNRTIDPHFRTWWLWPGPAWRG